MKKIKDFVKKYNILYILGFIFLFHLFDKYLFSLSSIPWAISYSITSLWNGQFDSRILNDILTEYNILYQINIILYSLYFGIILKAIKYFTDKRIKKTKGLKVFFQILEIILFIYLLCGFLLLFSLFTINGFNNLLLIFFGIVFILLFIYLLFKYGGILTGKINIIFIISIILIFMIFIFFYSYFYYYIIINYHFYYILPLIFIPITYLIFNIVISEKFDVNIKNIKEINLDNIFYLSKRYLLANRYIILLSFIGIILTISFLNINNGKIFQGVLPAKGYILIGDNSGKLKDLHNQLQLPEENTLKVYGLNEKIKFLDKEGKGKILSDFCILWETKNYYYVSTYMEVDDNGNFNCYSNGKIEPFIIYKNSDVTLRYFNYIIKYKGLEYTIYSKLFTNNKFNYIFLRKLYNVITANYIGGEDIDENGFNFYFSDITMSYSFKNKINENVGDKFVDKFINIYLEQLKNKEINYNILSDELLKREKKLEDFYSGTNFDVKDFLIKTDEIKKNILVYASDIEKIKENSFKNYIINFLKIYSTINYSRDDFLNIYVLDDKKIKNIAGLKKVYVYIKDDNIELVEKNIFDKLLIFFKKTKIFYNNNKKGCIEILSDDYLLYHIKDVDITFVYGSKFIIDYTNKKVEYYGCPDEYND